MKSKIFLTTLVIVLSFVLFSCKSTGTDDGKVATLKTEKIDTESLKKEIVEIIMSLPDNSETVNLINETGAAYVGGLTFEDLEAGKLHTQAENAKAYGGVLFDLAYANTYNQVNTFSKLMEINKAIVGKLGYNDFLSEQKKFEDRYTENKENRDSVNQIVAELLSSSNEYIQEQGNAEDIALIFSGATTKSLYVISNVTLFAANNGKLLDLMKNQKDRVKSAIKILELSGDNAEVAKMVAAMKPILTVYGNESFDLSSVEKISQLTSFVMK